MTSSYSFRAISLAGELAFVGDDFKATDANRANPIRGAGAVYVLKRQAYGTWPQEQKLVNSDRVTCACNGFGLGVVASNGIALINGHGIPHFYVFGRPILLINKPIAPLVPKPDLCR